jgi:hypothetical protein
VPLHDRPVRVFRFRSGGTRRVAAPPLRILLFHEVFMTHLRTTLFLFVSMVIISCTPASAADSELLGDIIKEYECSVPVENRGDAARCFNRYFEKKMALLEKQRGTMPNRIREMMQPVSEDEIVTEDRRYRIKRRDGGGSPYFMKDGVIYLDFN